MAEFQWNQGKPVIVDWEIPQGSYQYFDFHVADDDDVPFDCTGLLGRGQIRPRPGAPTLVGNLTVTAVDASIGHWRVECLPAALAGYNFGPRKSATDYVECHYDVEIYDPEDPTRVDRRIAGKALISVEVTK